MMMERWYMERKKLADFHIILSQGMVRFKQDGEVTWDKNIIIQE